MKPTAKQTCCSMQVHLMCIYYKGWCGVSQIVVITPRSGNLRDTLGVRHPRGWVLGTLGDQC